MDKPKLKLLGIFCPELYGFKLRIITRFAENGHFCEMSHFEGQLPQNHTEHEGFDARTLHREIFCAETPEMMGVRLRTLELFRHKHR